MKLLGQAALTGVSLEALLGLLRQVMTPSQVIHVGAGSGQGPLSIWHGWEVGSSVLIDTAPEKLTGLVDKLGASSVQAIDAVLSDHVGEENFYELNLESESGFVSAENLKALWPGIETLEERLVATQTLDSILSAGNVGSPVGGESDSVSLKSNAWLLIDCLPAGKVLQGAIKSLENVNLVCARVLADEVVVEAASCDEIDGVLAEVGFARVAVLPGSHPKIGYGVFCRDVVGQGKERLEANAKLAKLQKTQADTESQTLQLQAELDGERKKAQGFEVELAAVQKKVAEESDAKAKLAEQLAAEQKAKSELLAMIEHKGKSLADLQKTQADTESQTLQLQAELDGERKRVQGFEVELAAVQKKVAEESDAKAKLAEQLAAEKKAKDDLNSKVEQHKKDKAEWDARQYLFSEEMAKAEGQIEIIKDLLLSEKRL